MLPIAQAELLVDKRSILEAAVALGQSAAGSEACANLGVVHDVIDPDTGKITQKRLYDPLLNWALTQEISPTTTAGGSERALAVRQLNEAQSIVIDHVTDLIKQASDGGVAYGSYTPTPQMVQNMLKGMIVGSRPYVTRDKTARRMHDYGMWMCVPMNTPRRPPPAPAMVALGGLLDTDTGLATLPSERAERYLTQTREVMGASRMDETDFHQWSSRLVSAAQYEPAGRSWLVSSYCALRQARRRAKKKGKRVRVFIGPGVLAEARFWLRRLASPAGISMFLRAFGRSR